MQRGEHKGEHDNAPLIAELLQLRQEQAKLLGYDNYAAYRLDDTMAKTPQAAEHLLEQVWAPAKHKAAAERAELAACANADGLNEPIAPWDWRYYAEKVRTARYDFDEAAVKPYFVLDNMVAALFDAAGKLFGVSFVPREDCPVYHPDVRAYAVGGAGGQPGGLFLHDNFARMGKRSGAWMSSYRDQENFDGPVLPIVVNNNNFSKGDPTLLSFDDAQALCSTNSATSCTGWCRTRCAATARNRAPRCGATSSSSRRRFSSIGRPAALDAAQLPCPALPDRRGRSPEALIRKLLAPRNFNQGFATVEYTACAMIHREPPTPTTLIPTSLVDIVAVRGASSSPELGCRPEIGLRHRPTCISSISSTAPGTPPGTTYAYVGRGAGRRRTGFRLHREGRRLRPRHRRAPEDDLPRRRHRGPDGALPRIAAREPAIEDQPLLAQRGLDQ